ncbi:MAG: hypothetical protein LJE69_13735 [Thiohalocapsa sp.]|uniref:hypothetical protein n=1 Tax=Thiohalocapsa sp. TaxID=2497641 RepID=UPI0025FE201F|nr:hypothetical protein [Thiohalocapsa sp.]MCG6942297.1 hypothetical protein [Thiohalocapsa sp.]
MAERAAFDALAREFFSVWFRYRPEAALAAAVGDYGSLPAPQSDDDHAALGSWLETLVVALEELNHDALDPARRLDAELLFALAVVEHRELLERDWRHRDPLRYLPLTEIHRLTLLCPLSLRGDLLGLLTAIPAHLRLAMTQLTPMAELIPPPLVAAAVEAAEVGPGYLRALARSRWLRTQCHGSGQIEDAAEAAATALRQYASGLRSVIAPRAAGACGCGAEHLRFLLRRRHQLTLAPADCAPLLERLARQLNATAGAEQALPGTAPTSGDGIGAECARQEALLRAAELFTLPVAPLRVAGGPACPRLGAATDQAMRPLDARELGLDYVPDLTRGRGILYIADGTTAAAARGPLSQPGRCLELGWGGLHTLTFAGGMAARSLPRLLAGGTSLTQGWPLSLAAYVWPEQPELVEAVRRTAVAHARLDLDLHLGRVGLADARARAAALGNADQVLAALIRNPGDALAAVLGWQLIDAGRRQLTAGDSGPVALRKLHDGLLGQGPVPASVALAGMLGDAAVSALLNNLITSADATV